MTRQRSARKGVRKTTLRMNVNIGLVSLVMVMFVMITVMGVVSLASLNSQATSGYEIQRLEAERQSFIADGELNDMLILNARSLDTIMDSPVVENMVRIKSSEIAYVEPLVTVASSAY